MGTKKKPLGAWGRWRERRVVLRESKALLAEARRIYRKQHKKLKEPVAEEFQVAIAKLTGARQDGEVEPIRRAAEAVDGLLRKHLAFARKSAVREYTESIGVAVLIALLLRAFVVEAFKIPSGSMIPTLKVGDHIFVSKFIYGLRIPLTHIKFFARAPERGDVVVFIYPVDESKDFIKRVIAIGGDSVAVRRNIIYVNGKAVPRRRLDVPCRYRDADEHGLRDIRDCKVFEERHGSNHYRVIQDVNTDSLDYPETKVPEGHIFVMGDNRDNSHDGRVWGFVPYESIKGKALIVWLSRGEPDGLRWRRFFHSVHAYNEGRKNLSVHDGLSPGEYPSQ